MRAQGHAPPEPPEGLVTDSSDGSAPAAALVSPTTEHAPVLIGAMAATKAVSYAIQPIIIPARAAASVKRHVAVAAEPEPFAPMTVAALTVRAATVLQHCAVLTAIAAPVHALIWESPSDVPAL